MFCFYQSKSYLAKELSVYFRQNGRNGYYYLKLKLQLSHQSSCIAIIFTTINLFNINQLVQAVAKYNKIQISKKINTIVLFLFFFLLLLSLLSLFLLLLLVLLHDYFSILILNVSTRNANK